MLADRLRAVRRARGLTQAQLAEQAGVSRQLVSAIESGRHLPRVDAAVALARVLGEPVEALLSPLPAAADGVLAPPQDGQLVRVARVGQRLVCTPADPAGESWSSADGIVRDGRVELFDGEPQAAVVGGCDPAIGLAGRLVEEHAGPHVVAVNASSRTATEALTTGRLHAAVVHGPDGRLPHAPSGLRRIEVARWQVGLAAPPDLPGGWVQAALTGHAPVVQREPGAGSQAAFERARAAALSASDASPAARARTAEIAGTPLPQARGHLDAAAIARRSGCAAVSIEPAALALGLRFHPLEVHVCELWVPTDHLDVPALRRFVDELTGRRLHRRLAAIGGYDLSRSGTEVAA